MCSVLCLKSLAHAKQLQPGSRCTYASICTMVPETFGIGGLEDLPPIICDLRSCVRLIHFLHRTVRCLSRDQSFNIKINADCRSALLSTQLSAWAHRIERCMKSDNGMLQTSGSVFVSNPEATKERHMQYDGANNYIAKSPVDITSWKCPGQAWTKLSYMVSEAQRCGSSSEVNNYDQCFNWFCVCLDTITYIIYFLPQLRLNRQTGQRSSKQQWKWWLTNYLTFRKYNKII